jgi:hypothetical protein
MDEYIISSVTSNLPKTKRNEALYKAFKGYESFLLSEEGEKDFNILLEAQIEVLNDNAPRAIPLKVIRSSYGDSLYYTIRGNNTDQGLSIMMRRVRGRFEAEKIENV